MYADIGEEVLLPELPSEDDENPGEENEVKQAVDFQKLLSINEEVVAWISITALELEYPVTQGEDNEYYLQGSRQPDYQCIREGILSDQLSGGGFSGSIEGTFAGDQWSRWRKDSYVVYL